MQNNQRSWSSIASELRKKIDESGLEPGEIASKACIDYHAARRLCRGGLRNSSKNAIMLCHFFGVPLHENAKMQNLSHNHLYECINQIWDGSQAHAELIMELIKSTQPFQFTSRK